MKKPSRWTLLRKAVRDIVWPEGAVDGGGRPYSGSSVNRLFADWLVPLLSPDDETRFSLRQLRARCRDLARNNAYARQYLTLLSVNVIGPEGATLQARVTNNSGDLAETINERIEDGFEEWSQSATLSGQMSRVSLEHQMIQNVAHDGEVFVRMWIGPNVNRFGFALEAVDPDLIDEKMNVAPGENQAEVRMGIEVDSFGRPTAYYVYDKPETINAQPRNRTRVPASEMIHLYIPKRPNQTRGVPWFHAVMNAMKMLDGYDEAELVAARVSAAKMGFFVRKESADPAAIVTPPPGNQIMMEAQPGTLEYAPEGYGIEQFSPDHPSGAYPSFIKACLRRIAAGLGVSYNSLASDLEQVNYSSMRSGLLIERDNWRALQRWWINAFYRRIYPQWLNAAMLSQAVVLDTRDFRKFLDVKWTPRGWQWVDPVKDTQAAVGAIHAGLGSRTAVLAEQGLDYEEVIEQLAEETKIADQFGVDITGGVPTVTAVESGSDETAGTTGGTGTNYVTVLRPRKRLADALNGGHK